MSNILSNARPKLLVLALLAAAGIAPAAYAQSVCDLSDGVNGNENTGGSTGVVNSLACGTTNTASMDGSVAVGVTNTASGTNSTALGTLNEATGDSAP